MHQLWLLHAKGQQGNVIKLVPISISKYMNRDVIDSGETQRIGFMFRIYASVTSDYLMSRNLLPEKGIFMVSSGIALSEFLVNYKV